MTAAGWTRRAWWLAWATHPAVLGAIFVLVLSCALEPDARDVPGLLDAGARADVATRMEIAALAVGLGALLGAFAQALVALRRCPGRAASRRPWAERVDALAITLLLHAGVVAWAMADRPALYARAFYAQGGLRRTIQVVTCDVLGTSGVALLGLATAVLYVAGAPSRWRWPGFLMTAAARAIRARGVAAPLLGLLLAALVVAMAPRAAPVAAREGSGRPDVVLLALGSIRADRLDPRTMPKLAALAARGATFDRAYVSRAGGRSSWIPWLTGRYAKHRRDHAPDSTEAAPDLDALPSRLARAGYATAVLDDDGEGTLVRAPLGFQEIDAPAADARDLARRRVLAAQLPLLPFLTSRLGRLAFPAVRGIARAQDPDRVADDAIAAIEARRRSARPYFLTVALGSARAPGAHTARASRAAYRGRYKYDAVVDAGDAPPDADDVTQIRALYDDAVASVDAAVARIVTAAGRGDPGRRTILIVTSDQGASLFDAGRGVGDAGTLAGDGASHVPLVVIDPRQAAPRRVPDVVRDVDLVPTIYALAGVAPPADLDGRSFASALRGEPIEPALAFAESDDGGAGATSALDPALDVRVQRMARDRRWKLRYVPTRKGAVCTLFDTLADPGETRDVTVDHPAEKARLEAALRAWTLADPSMTIRGDLFVPRASAPAPYDVVWIVTHGRDAGATLDALSSRGVTFARAYAAATSTRAAMRAMLSGGRPGEVAPDDEARVPRLLRDRGLATGAFVADAVVPRGVASTAPAIDRDGFDRLDRVPDGATLSARALDWMASQRRARSPFFALCAYGAGHSTDAAVGALVRSLDSAGLGAHTLVVVTADHAGPARSPDEDVASTEVTTHVPIVLVLPGVLAPRTVTARVGTRDLAPTVLDLEGIDTVSRRVMSGRSLLPLARGVNEPDPRAVVTEGDGARAIIVESLRYIARAAGKRGGTDGLYDLGDDPGERHDLSRQRPDLLLEMRARLAAALAGVPIAGSVESLAPPRPTADVLRLRFSGGGRARRVSGTLTVGDPREGGRDHATAIEVEPVGAGKESIARRGARIELALTMLPADVVGLDLRVEPAGLPVRWELWMDDAPWPEGAVYAGRFGLAAPELLGGLVGDDARDDARAPAPPSIDPASDLGLFVTRE
jgi:arylsulfatase A-like enzyme